MKVDFVLRVARSIFMYVMMSCDFGTFPYGVLGQVWYLIVPIPDKFATNPPLSNVENYVFFLTIKCFMYSMLMIMSILCGLSQVASASSFQY